MTGILSCSLHRHGHLLHKIASGNIRHDGDARNGWLVESCVHSISSHAEGSAKNDDAFMSPSQHVGTTGSPLQPLGRICGHDGVSVQWRVICSSRPHIKQACHAHGICFAHVDIERLLARTFLHAQQSALDIVHCPEKACSKALKTSRSIPESYLLPLIEPIEKYDTSLSS